MTTTLGRSDTTIVIRPAIPADRDAIVRMHAACSLTSRHRRWQAPLPDVPRRYLDDALSGRPGHVALVAAGPDGDVLALASAVDDGAGEWEIGVLVRDDAQRRGLGGRLAVELAFTARARGACALAADLLPETAFLTRTLARLGPVRTSIADGLRARVALSPAA